MYLAGFHIKYTALSNVVDDEGQDRQSGSFSIQTIINVEARSHVFSGLEENTRYIVYIQPFFQSIEGSASNSIHINTLEDGMPNLNDDEII